MENNLTIRFSLPVGLPFVSRCFFNGSSNCTLPGAVIEFLKFYAEYRNFVPLIAEAKEYGIGDQFEGNRSTVRMLANGAVDMLGPHFWFIYERATIPGLKVSPPLGYDELLAVVKTPSQRVSQFFYTRVNDLLVTIPILAFNVEIRK